jgi:Plasmid stabilization system protein
MRVLVTKQAEKTYRSIKAYIIEEWGEKVAEAFEQKTVDFLNLLSKFPEMGTLEVPEKQIRGFLLSKQTRVFYRIKNDKLIILTFFDVRQSPKKKPR